MHINPKCLRINETTLNCIPWPISAVKTKYSGLFKGKTNRHENVVNREVELESYVRSKHSEKLLGSPHFERHACDAGRSTSRSLQMRKVGLSGSTLPRYTKKTEPKSVTKKDVNHSANQGCSRMVAIERRSWGFSRSKRLTTSMAGNVPSRARDVRCE